MSVRLLLGATVMGVVIACGSSVSLGDANQPLGNDHASEGGALECRFPATRDTWWEGGLENRNQSHCPAHCSAVDAMQLDEANACRRIVVLGCMSGGYGGPSTAWCFRNTEDGRLVQAMPTLLQGPRWVRCSAEEEQRMTVDPCPAGPPISAASQCGEPPPHGPVYAEPNVDETKLGAHCTGCGGCPEDENCSYVPGYGHRCVKVSDTCAVLRCPDGSGCSGTASCHSVLSCRCGF